MDSTEKGHTGLASYYTQQGETPGIWVGSGMAGIEGLEAGDMVTAEQMRFLFGSGHHPLGILRGTGRYVNPAHFGQPLPWVRALVAACHAWPAGHNHHTFLGEPAVTRSGARSLLRLGCHWAASSADIGHPLPPVRCWTLADHVCPSGHCHQTFLPDPAVNWSGVSAPLSVGCHWATSSFGIGSPVRPAHLGQPPPRVRLWILASRVWPSGHSHQTFRCEPAVTWSGVRSPFSVGCHSEATRGQSIGSGMRFMASTMSVTRLSSLNCRICRYLS